MNIEIERKFLLKSMPDLKPTEVVDKFDGHLIIAEIEIPEQDYEVVIPDYIKKRVIIEVTGIKQFSNKNLSNKI